MAAVKMPTGNSLGRSTTRLSRSTSTMNIAPTNAETGNTTKVLDGDIEMFAAAYLKWKLRGSTGAAVN